MNHRERILAAVHHQQTDITPYSLGLTQQSQQRMADYLGHDRFATQIDPQIMTVYCDGWLLF